MGGYRGSSCPNHSRTPNFTLGLHILSCCWSINPYIIKALLKYSTTYISFLSRVRGGSTIGITCLICERSEYIIDVLSKLRVNFVHDYKTWVNICLYSRMVYNNTNHFNDFFPSRKRNHWKMIIHGNIFLLYSIFSR